MEKSQATVSKSYTSVGSVGSHLDDLQATVPPSIEPLASESERSTQDYTTSIYIELSTFWPALVMLWWIFLHFWRQTERTSWSRPLKLGILLFWSQEIGQNVPGSSLQLHVVHLPGEEMGLALRMKHYSMKIGRIWKNNAKWGIDKLLRKNIK